MAAKKKAAPKKTAKPAKPAKAKKVAEAAAPATPGANTFQINEQDRQLFVGNHLPKIKSLKEKLNTANANLRNAYKSAKADGFSKVDFETAIALEDAEKEAATKARIARQLVIARYVNSDLGGQLELFLDEAPVSAANRFFEEGRLQAMQKGPAKPPYDPGTDQYNQYMEGFHSVSEQNAKGIKKLEPKPKPEKTEAASKDKAAAAKPAPDPVEKEPVPEQTSDIPMSRAQFLASRAGSDTKQ